MKIKKIKLLKALALTSSLGIVATVPIIVSSCSTTSSSNGNNNGGNNNGGNNNGGNNNGGTDTGGGDTSNTKVTPEFQSSVILIGSIGSIYNGTDNTSTLLETDLQKDPSKLLTNADKLGSGIKITVNGDLSNSKWGSEEYSTWKEKATSEVYYQITDDQFDITSPDDLHDQLSKENALSTIFKSILGDNNVSGKTYALTENANWGVDGDLLHVSVTEATSGNASSKIYDLAIPVSDINLNMKCSVTVSGDNIISTTKDDLLIKYDIGINSKSTYEGPTEVQEMTDVSADSVLVKLGLATTKTSTAIATQKSSFNITRQDDTTTSTVELDNQKIGETLGVFNTEFSGQTLTEDASSAKAIDDNTATYTLSLQGKPTEGHTWEDGTSDAQSFKFKVKIKKIATFDNTGSKLSVPSSTTIKWENSGIDPSSSNNDSKFEEKLEAFATKGTDEGGKIQSILTQLTDIFVKQGGLTNAHVTLLKDDKEGYLKYGTFNGSTNNVWQIRVTAKPDNGYTAAKDKDFTTIKSWIVVTITQ